MKDAIIVSHEMTALIGSGASPETSLPPNPVVFRIAGLPNSGNAKLSYDPRHDRNRDVRSPLVLVVSLDACRRLFPVRPDASVSWHLPSALAALALSIIECEGQGEARNTLRLARSIELLCQIHAALADGHALIPVDGHCELSELDIARVAVARRVVDEKWAEKLTIAELARLAGINRDKLARGFQSLYGVTIAHVLGERRLSEAKRLLLASDLPVATIAYRCAYHNNAAFTRAFSRRYGIAPSAFRRMGIAA